MLELKPDYTFVCHEDDYRQVYVIGPIGRESDGECDPIAQVEPIDAPGFVYRVTVFGWLGIDERVCNETEEGDRRSDTIIGGKYHAWTHVASKMLDERGWFNPFKANEGATA